MGVLIVGSGLVGGTLARQLTADGITAVLCSRRRPPSGGTPTTWLPLDATDADACARTVDAVQPDAVVLVHGPSDVTWCESQPDAALTAHALATTNLAVAAAGARFLLVSTDNVFDGQSPVNDELARTNPANAYGRAKLEAERILREKAEWATVLRVSLVYGWHPAGASTWVNHFAHCVAVLGRGETVSTPDDHWNTPVLVDDVALVVTTLLSGEAPSLLHLGGPDRVSRFDWALRIADALGRPRSLVTAVPRLRSRYACRPVNACLTSVYLDGLSATRDIRIHGVDAGISALLRQQSPGRPGTPGYGDGGHARGDRHHAHR